MRDSHFQTRLTGLGKSLFILGVLTLISFTTNIKTANSQTRALTPESTHLQNILPNHCRFAGTFTQSKNLAGLPVPLHSSGTFLFDCELGLVWHTQQPVPETRVYTQQDLHFQIDANDEIENKDSVIQLYIADLLLGIMSADHDFIANNFSLITQQIKASQHEKEGEPESENKSATNSVTLQPTSALLKKGLNSIRLHKTAQQLALNLLDNKNQHTLINSTETQRYATQQHSIDACIKLFPTGSVCAVLTDPNTYAELSNTQANQ